MTTTNWQAEVRDGMNGQSAAIRVDTNDADSLLFADGWSHKQPAIGGRWLWREGDNCEAVELMLSAGGGFVEKCVDVEPEGTAQFYWEQTETTQRVMPGLWKRMDTIG